MENALWMKTAAAFLLGLDPINTSTHTCRTELSPASPSPSLHPQEPPVNCDGGHSKQPSVHPHPTKSGTVCPAGMGLSDGCVPPSNLQLFQAAQSHMLTWIHYFSPSPPFFFFPTMEFPSVWDCAKQRAWDEETHPTTNFCRQESSRNPCQTWRGACLQHRNADCGCCQKPAAFWCEKQVPRKAVVSSSHQLMQRWVLNMLSTSSTHAVGQALVCAFIPPLCNNTPIYRQLWQMWLADFSVITWVSTFITTRLRGS